jgi:hypothetical protein
MTENACMCGICVERRTNKEVVRPYYSVMTRPPRIGDFIFVDSDYKFYKWHSVFYLILECEVVTGLAKNTLDKNYGFDYRTLSLMFKNGKMQKTPFMMRYRDRYWLYGEA